MARTASTVSRSETDLHAVVPAYVGVSKSALTIAGILFGLFSIGHLLWLPPGTREVLAVVAGGSAVTLLGSRVAIWFGILSFGFIRYAVFLVAAVAWVNSTLHLWLSQDPMQSTNLAIVVIASGILMFSREQFAGICAACVLSFAAGAMSTSAGDNFAQWVHYGVFMFQALILASATFFWKRAILLRNVALQRDQVRSRMSEHQFLLAAQSKAIEAERNLRRALDADAAKSMFLANMSHELRTPLNSVVGFAQLLKERPEIASNPVQVAEYAACIQTSGSHLLGLINQILDFSRANAGFIKLEDGEVDLGMTLIEIAKLMGPQAAESRVELVVHAGADQFYLRGDDLRVRQIVTNLLANAFKFTPAGGRVDVTAAFSGAGMVLEVRDTGVGIAMQDQARVFEPFVQAEGGLDKPHEGTGLGLAITKKLVELHGGTISLKSVLGEGSTFTVRFPAERTSAHRRRKSA